MVRTRILSLAILVLMGTMAFPAEESKKDENRAGFRVYTISFRCQTRTLVGIYDTLSEAFQVANRLRPEGIANRVEVTTGTERKTLPAGRPVLYQVYTRSCSRSDWQPQGYFMDESKVEVAVKAAKAKGQQVEVVRDYAPKEVFHVYGRQGCRTLASQKSRLLGTYVTAREACEAAVDFRRNKGFRCEVTTGTKGEDLLDGSPTQYKVYVRSCRVGWRVEETTTEAKKALELADARAKAEFEVEVVFHYTR